MEKDTVWQSVGNRNFEINTKDFEHQKGEGLKQINNFTFLPQRTPEYDSITPEEKRNETNEIKRLLLQIVNNTAPIQDILVIAGKSKENQDLIIEILQLMNAKDGNEAEEKYSNVNKRISGANLAGETFNTLTQLAMTAWQVWKVTHGIS